MEVMRSRPMDMAIQICRGSWNAWTQVMAKSRVKPGKRTSSIARAGRRWVGTGTKIMAPWTVNPLTNSNQKESAEADGTGGMAFLIAKVFIPRWSRSEQFSFLISNRSLSSPITDCQILTSKCWLLIPSDCYKIRKGIVTISAAKLRCTVIRRGTSCIVF